MTTTIALIGAGAMGAATGKRLALAGARVLTDLEGRSAATQARAEAAGMIAAPLSDLAAADLVLSIVPPDQALTAAQRLAPALAASKTKPAYVDFNAVSPATARAVAAIVAPTGAVAVDGGIIGGPPAPSGRSPAYYVSGDPDRRTDALEALSLRLKRIEGGIGAASALKMSYAGITKGMTGLGAAMMLAATYNGAADSLREEMSESQAEVLKRYGASIPDMYPKAYRFVGEMNEIADYLGPDDPAAALYRAMGQVFQRFADDQDAGGAEAARIAPIIKPA